MEPGYSGYSGYKAWIDEQGIAGELPRYPMDFATLEQRASTLAPWLLTYIRGGAGDERTQRANVEAFDRWGLVPRMLRGVSEADMSTSLFGLDLPHPLFLCPIGLLGLCPDDEHGDLAAARAAARTGVPMAVSTLTQDPLEDIAEHLGTTPGFFQLYVPTDRDLAYSLIDRAERAGYKALVVTLDTWTTGWRPGDLATASFPQRRGKCLANYLGDKYFRKLLDTEPEDDPPVAAAMWHDIFGYSLTLDDLDWIRAATKLPIVLKGINHPEDVRSAKDRGADGIYCSNHGGRHANGGLPALQALPAIVEAAGDTPVLFDSGVRSGTDMVKALALGASAVGIGRPLAYALAVDGQAGVEHLLRSFLAEAALLMELNGYPDLAALRKEGLRLVGGERRSDDPIPHEPGR